MVLEDHIAESTSAQSVVTTSAADVHMLLVQKSFTDNGTSTSRTVLCLHVQTLWNYCEDRRTERRDAPYSGGNVDNQGIVPGPWALDAGTYLSQTSTYSRIK